MNPRSVSAATPTHRAIAAAAGVSLSTVSLALREVHRVQAGTAAKIRATAERLGYRANPGVSMWMAHVRATRSPRFQEVLGYVHTIPRDHSFRRYMPFDLYRKGAEARAKELGYQLSDFEWHAEGMTGHRLRQILHAQGIRGLIFEYNDFEETGQYSIGFDWTGFTAVSLGGRPSNTPIHNVASNFFDGVRLAHQKLVELGFTRIGLSLHLFTDRSINYEISGGFLCAQSLNADLAARIPIHNTDVVQGWDRRGFFSWFEKHRPQVIASPDQEVLAFMKHFGLRVPQDVGFVHLMKPAGSEGTGLDHHPEHMGSVAVDLLSSLLHTNQSGPVQLVRRELLEPTWFAGNSLCSPLTRRPVRAPKTALPLRVYSRLRDYQGPGQDHDRVLKEKYESADRRRAGRDLG